jgi:drug/metabolite transporter (DMT)-like permease
MYINPTLGVVYSELVLSLYPILIKTVQTNIFTQTLARFLVFPTLALIFGKSTDFTNIWTNPWEAFAATLHGIFNLGHVLVSYISFKNLPAGSSIALFYLYPIFNAIVGSFAFGETLPTYSILLFGLAIIGTYLISSSHLDKSDPAKYKKRLLGIVSAILAAVTETVIFYFVRTNEFAKSPFYTVNHLYPSGLLALLLIGFTSKYMFDFSSTNWMKLIGFNAVIGFTGYISRFYSISRVPTLVFSLLSFIGVIAGYAWGLLFTDESVSARGIVGGLCIASSIAILRYFN